MPAGTTGTDEGLDLDDGIGGHSSREIQDAELLGNDATDTRQPLLGSVKEEFAARSKHCSADYNTAYVWASKTLSASLFMFFATLFSTVALGAHLQLATDNRIGLSEYLVMSMRGSV
jgi:hypothetical protein